MAMTTWETVPLTMQALTTPPMMHVVSASIAIPAVGLVYPRIG